MPFAVIRFPVLLNITIPMMPYSDAYLPKLAHIKVLAYELMKYKLP